MKKLLLFSIFIFSFFCSFICLSKEYKIYEEEVFTGKGETSGVGGFFGTTDNNIAERLPDFFSSLIRNLPIYQIVLNTQLEYAGKQINILPLIITNIINLIIFILTLVISYKKFRK